MGSDSDFNTIVLVLVMWLCDRWFERREKDNGGRGGERERERERERRERERDRETERQRERRRGEIKRVGERGCEMVGER